MTPSQEESEPDLFIKIPAVDLPIATDCKKIWTPNPKRPAKSIQSANAQVGRHSASHYGIALRAMHDSEDATRVVGVNSTLLKALMLFVSAFMTGVVGAFNVHYINFLEPDYAFSGLWVTLPIVAAIFGGYRTIVGPLAGAVILYLIDQLVFKNLIPSGHQLILGALLVAMIIFSPGGLVPLLGKGLRTKHASA